MIIVLLIYLILDVLKVTNFVVIFLSFLILILLIVLEVFFESNYKSELKNINLINDLMHLILIFRLNDGIEDSIIHSYEQINKITLESEKRNKKIEEIKIRVNNDYFNIFIDACLNNNNYTLLNKLEKQITLFSMEKEITMQYKTLIGNKIYLALSLCAVLFSLMFHFEVNKLCQVIYFVSIISLFVFYVITYMYIVKSNNKNENIVFFYKFYLWSMFKKPYVAFDLALEHHTKKHKIFYDKNKIINGNYEDSILKIDKEEKRQYLLTIDILKRNACVKELYCLRNNQEEKNIYLKKVIHYFYFFVPIITFIIVKFYL